MEIRTSGKNIQISDRFRSYVEEKADKVGHLSQNGQAFEVKVVKEPNARVAETSHTVELTVIGKGPVVRAEAQSVDKFSGFDIAFDKLLERLRRAHDKRSRRPQKGPKHPISVAEATAGLEPVPTGTPIYEQSTQEAAAGGEAEGFEDYTPVKIRRKVFPAETMGIDDAIDNMELVGHDFYLFIDSESGRPHVVYRKTGWDFGVIALDDEASEESHEELLSYRAGESEARPQG